MIGRESKKYLRVKKVRKTADKKEPRVNIEGRAGLSKIVEGWSLMLSASWIMSNMRDHCH